MAPVSTTPSYSFTKHLLTKKPDLFRKIQDPAICRTKKMAILDIIKEDGENVDARVTKIENILREDKLITIKPPTLNTPPITPEKKFMRTPPEEVNDSTKKKNDKEETDKEEAFEDLSPEATRTTMRKLFEKNVKLNGEVENLRIDIANKTRQNHHIIDHNKHLQSKEEKLKQNLVKKDEEIRNYKRFMNKNTEDMKFLTSKYNEQKESLAKEKELVKGINMEFQKLKEKFDNTQFENDDLKAKIEDMEEKTEGYYKEILQNTKDRNTQEENIKILKQRSETADAILEKRNSKIATLQKKNDKQDSDLQEMTKNYRLMTQSKNNEVLRMKMAKDEELEEVKKKVEMKIEKMHDDYKKILDEQQEKLLDQKENLSKQTKKIFALEEEINEWEKEAEELNEKINELETDVKNYEMEKEDLQNQLKIKDQKIKKLKKEKKIREKVIKLDKGAEDRVKKLIEQANENIQEHRSKENDATETEKEKALGSENVEQENKSVSRHPPPSEVIKESKTQEKKEKVEENEGEADIEPPNKKIKKEEAKEHSPPSSCQPSPPSPCQPSPPSGEHPLPSPQPPAPPASGATPPLPVYAPQQPSSQLMLTYEAPPVQSSPPDSDLFNKTIVESSPPREVPKTPDTSIPSDNIEITILNQNNTLDYEYEEQNYDLELSEDLNITMFLHHLENIKETE